MRQVGARWACARSYVSRALLSKQNMGDGARSLYDVLGVPSDASRSAILARAPAVAKPNELAEQALLILGDPVRRAAYDRARVKGRAYTFVDFPGGVVTRANIVTELSPPALQSLARRAEGLGYCALAAAAAGLVLVTATSLREADAAGSADRLGSARRQNAYAAALWGAAGGAAIGLGLRSPTAAIVLASANAVGMRCFVAPFYRVPFGDDERRLEYVYARSGPLAGAAGAGCGMALGLARALRRRIPHRPLRLSWLLLLSLCWGLVGGRVVALLLPDDLVDVRLERREPSEPSK